MQINVKRINHLIALCWVTSCRSQANADLISCTWPMTANQMTSFACLLCTRAKVETICRLTTMRRSKNSAHHQFQASASARSHEIDTNHRHRLLTR